MLLCVTYHTVVLRIVLAVLCKCRVSLLDAFTTRTTCRTPKTLKKRNERASRRPSVNGVYAFARAVQRTNNGHLNNHVIFGTMAGDENLGTGRPEKERFADDLRVF